MTGDMEVVFDAEDLGNPARENRGYTFIYFVLSSIEDRMHTEQLLSDENLDEFATVMEMKDAMLSESYDQLTVRISNSDE